MKYLTEKYLVCPVAAVMFGLGACCDPDPAPQLVLTVTQLPPEVRKVEVFFDGVAVKCETAPDKNSAVCTSTKTSVVSYEVNLFDAMTEDQPDYGCRIFQKAANWPPEVIELVVPATSDRNCRVTINLVPVTLGAVYLNPGRMPITNPQYFPAPPGQKPPLLAFDFVATDPKSPTPIYVVRNKSANEWCKGTGSHCDIPIESATEITLSAP